MRYAELLQIPRPVGLDIGAEESAEIAISIVADIISLRRARLTEVASHRVA